MKIFNSLMAAFSAICIAGVLTAYVLLEMAAIGIVWLHTKLLGNQTN